MTTKYMSNPVQTSADLCKKADLLREKNEYKTAISKYLNAILLKRDDAKSYFGLGICHKHIGNYKKAIRYFEKSAELNNDYKSYFELGVCHMLNGTPCEAIKSFVKAVQIEPDNPEAILQLGISHELCEEHDMALMIYQKLIENSPEFVKAYDYKSSLLMKMDRYREATDVLKSMIKVDPSYNKAYAGIGVCLDKLGQKTDAQRYYRKYLSHQTDGAKSDFIQARFNKLRQKSDKNPLSLVTYQG